MIELEAKSVSETGRSCDERQCRDGFTKTGRIRKGARVILLRINGDAVAAFCPHHANELRTKLWRVLHLSVPPVVLPMSAPVSDEMLRVVLFVGCVICVVTTILLLVCRERGG